ncbi:hypothetical protein SO802_021912 [Lithocarpus litseifolius]|uniref:Uncharacterized protein n=1 Tax=Lithocarpus litseifolius TaxID=425828 RepID=A0AAW2CHI3_9ROSI
MSASVNLIPLCTLQATGILERKIQGCLMEAIGFEGRGEYTTGHIQLWLKVGPIASLACFHVVKTEAPSGESSISKPQGIFVPRWEDIQDDPEPNLRKLLMQKKKRKEAPILELDDVPRCVRVWALMVESSINYEEESNAEKEEEITVEKDVQVAAEERLEEVDLGSNPQESKPISISSKLSEEEKLVVHTLNVDPEAKPVAQPAKVFHTKIEEL